MRIACGRPNSRNAASKSGRTTGYPVGPPKPWHRSKYRLKASEIVSGVQRAPFPVSNHPLKSAPYRVGPIGMGQRLRRRRGPAPPTPRDDQAFPFEDIANRAGRRPPMLRMTPLQPRPHLLRSPLHMPPLTLQNTSAQLSIHFMWMRMRRPRTVPQARRTLRPVARHPLVARLPANAKLPAQRRKPALLPQHLTQKLHPLIHYTTHFPSHGQNPPGHTFSKLCYPCARFVLDTMYPVRTLSP